MPPSAAPPNPSLLSAALREGEESSTFTGGGRGQAGQAPCPWAWGRHAPCPWAWGQSTRRGASPPRRRRAAAARRVAAPSMARTRPRSPAGDASELEAATAARGAWGRPEGLRPPSREDTSRRNTRRPRPGGPRAKATDPDDADRTLPRGAPPTPPGWVGPLEEGRQTRRGSPCLFHFPPADCLYDTCIKGAISSLSSWAVATLASRQLPPLSEQLEESRFRRCEGHAPRSHFQRLQAFKFEPAGAVCRVPSAGNPLEPRTNLSVGDRSPSGRNYRSRTLGRGIAPN